MHTHTHTHTYNSSLQDIAAHTRVSPTAREQAFRNFVKRMKATPKAMEELDGWGLALDSGLAELSGDSSGRHLPSEKILFKNRTVVAGDDADWGRDVVKEEQIVTVSELFSVRVYNTTCMFIYTCVCVA